MSVLSRGSGPASVDPTNERRSVAWIGASVVVKGDLMSSEDLMIAGRVEGEIMVPNHGVIIGPKAKIRADIEARTVAVHGEVVGQVTAAERVEIGATGSVRGDVTAPLMAVAEGGVVQGRLAVRGTASAD